MKVSEALGSCAHILTCGLTGLPRENDDCHQDLEIVIEKTEGPCVLTQMGLFRNDHNFSQLVARHAMPIN